MVGNIALKKPCFKEKTVENEEYQLLSMQRLSCKKKTTIKNNKKEKEKEKTKQKKNHHSFSK